MSDPAAIILTLLAAALLVAALVLAGLYLRRRRRERDLAELALAYRHLRGWGEFNDTEREAYIAGWMDQVYRPDIPAVPKDYQIAASAAYLSGWSASRDRKERGPAQPPEYEG